MADIKKNAKAGNMVRHAQAQAGGRLPARRIVHFGLGSPSHAIQVLTAERMQDLSQGSSPYTSIYPEIHPDASSTTSRLAQDADIEK
jgi:hypothetical protein